MSACFKVLIVAVVFLCLHDEAEAGRGKGSWQDIDLNMLDPLVDPANIDRKSKDGPKNDLVKNKLGKPDKPLFSQKMAPLKTEDLSKPKETRAKFENIRNRAEEEIELPTNFHAYYQWTECVSILDVPHEGPCKASWAIAAASSLSDRICISTEGKKQSRISAMDILTCCPRCTLDTQGDGCKGGNALYAIQQFEMGYATGGSYGDNKTCKPYQWSEKDSGVVSSPQCGSKCVNEEKYYDTRFFGKFTNKFNWRDTKGMMEEIYKRGPVIATLKNVPEDFMQYKSGVYQKKSDKIVEASRTVRIIGWGEENGTPYWLGVNSLGKSFGQNGTFQIIRGKDELNVESEVVAGLIDTSRIPPSK